MAEEEAARSGRYTLTADATRQMGRIAADLMQFFDGALQQIYGAIAAECPAPRKLIQHTGNACWRQLRTAYAAELRNQAMRLPEFIETADVDAKAGDGAPTVDGSRGHPGESELQQFAEGALNGAPSNNSSGGEGMR